VEVALGVAAQQEEFLEKETGPEEQKEVERVEGRDYKKERRDS